MEQTYTSRTFAGLHFWWHPPVQSEWREYRQDTVVVSSNGDRMGPGFSSVAVDPGLWRVGLLDDEPAYRRGAVGYDRKRKGSRNYYHFFVRLLRRVSFSMCDTGQGICMIPRGLRRSSGHASTNWERHCHGAEPIGLSSVTNGVDVGRREGGIFGVDSLRAVSRTQGQDRGAKSMERDWQDVVVSWDGLEAQVLERSVTIYLFLGCPEIYKGLIQMDLVIPREWRYIFKVILNNKPVGAEKAPMFHHGRGSQEGYFAELNSKCQMDHISVWRLYGNQLYLMASVLAHNVIRELQMIAKPPERGTPEKRTPRWIFEQLATLRNLLFQRTGKFTIPQKKLTFTMSANEAVQKDLLHFSEVLQEAA